VTDTAADRLNAIRTRANAATEGPWERYAEYGDNFFANTTGSHLQGVGDLNFGAGEQAEADEALVTHAQQDITWLLAFADGAIQTGRKQQEYIQELKGAADTDTIEALSDTLYDALYAITPYAEPHFADQGEGLKAAVRSVLDEAAAQQWIQKQLDETGLKAMDFRNGMAMELQPAREMVAQWVGAARGMLGDAPNYSETPITMEVKVAESPEQFAFTLQRVGKLTPHQARQKAEAELARIEREVLEAIDRNRNTHPDGTERLGLLAALRIIQGDRFGAPTTPECANG
jgi:hypothetical protein